MADIVRQLYKVDAGGIAENFIVGEGAREIVRLREALEMIEGKRQCPDSLMSDQDIARAALKHK